MATPTSQTATMLVTDLVGSTEVRVQLGEERAEALRRVHDRLLREAVTGHGGVVVKGLGDGVMARFDGAAEALAAAVAVQQAVTAHSRRHPEQPLVVRAGLSAGDVVVDDDGDCFGTPVIEAARLCGACEGGGVLTAGVVRVLARGRGGHVFEPAGFLDLKGLPEPVPAYRVVVPPIDHSGSPQLPLPPRLAIRPDFGFAGRAAELEVAGQRWKAASAGEGLQLLAVSGEPGMGKTAFVAELARGAHDDGAVVLYGRCNEELGLPYQPWVEALGWAVSHLPDELLAEHVARHGGELARLVPTLAQRVPSVPALVGPPTDAERWQLLADAAGLVQVVAEGRPVLLVLDDLHWADRPSVLLLRHLVTSIPLATVLIVATYRASEVGTDHPVSALLAELGRTPGTTRIDLGGLGDDELLTLVEWAAGQRLDPSAAGFVHTLRRETAGNPYFCEQILRHLVETGQLQQTQGGRWVVRPELSRLSLPQSVRDVVGRRVRRLGEEAVTVLSAAAVLGRDVEVGLLARLVEEDEDTVLGVLERAAAASLVQEAPGRPGWFTFVHALVQQTLYEGLSATRRARMHERAAELLEGVGEEGRQAEVAGHWLAAARPAEEAKLVEHAARAGDRAMEQLAPDQAARWYEEALAALGDRDLPQRSELLVRLGQAQRLCGDGRYRATLLEAGTVAQRLGPPGQQTLVEAALALNRGNVSSMFAPDHDRIALTQAALDALGPGDSAERARLLAILAAELLNEGPLQRRRLLVEEAVAVARRLGDDATLAAVVGTGQYAVWLPALLEWRDSITADALAAADRLNDPGARFWAARGRLAVAVERADLAGIDSCLQRMRSAAEAAPDPTMRWLQQVHEAWRAALAGDALDAEHRALAANEVAVESGQPDAAASLGMQLFFLRLQQGQPMTAGPLLSLPAGAMVQPATRAIACLALAEDGELEKARSLLEEAKATRFALHDDQLWIAALFALARAAARCGDRDAAKALAEVLAPWPGHVVFVGVAVAGAVGWAAGECAAFLGHHEQAEAWFAEADAAHRRLEAPYLIAGTELSWARALLARGGRAHTLRARSMIAEAGGLARRWGLAGLQADAAALAE